MPWDAYKNMLLERAITHKRECNFFKLWLFVLKEGMWAEKARIAYLHSTSIPFHEKWKWMDCAFQKIPFLSRSSLNKKTNKVNDTTWTNLHFGTRQPCINSLDLSLEGTRQFKL
jgi:hypothetical protein